MIAGVEPWVMLSLAAMLFLIGFMGLMIRRNLLIMLMCIEMMLNATNLTFVTFSRLNHDISGQIIVFFIIVVAAAESAIGLGLVIALFRTLRSVDTESIETLKE